MDQIFKPLFTTKARGMGMGLSICHSIIENDSGKIWATPGLGRGTIFQIELPSSCEKHELDDANRSGALATG